MKDTQLVDLFQRARKDSKTAVIEGAQALKHAIRFQADIQKIITCDLDLLKHLMNELAPDILPFILDQVVVIEVSLFAKLSPQPPRTKVIALAQRIHYSLDDIQPERPLIFLEDPRDLENIGAIIRVAAASDVAGVCVSGPADIWHPAIIRGAAGLHYALPVLNAEFSQLTQLERPVFALDPMGSHFIQGQIPSNALLIFGTERHGISEALLEKSDVIVSLPMKKGVSSLNLATSVAATLYKM